jgi:hypothetical protein
VLPFLLASDLAVPDVFPLPGDVRLNLLATALSGGRGAVLWVGIEALDAEYMNALRQGLEEIRELQRYVVAGERAKEVEIAPLFEHVRTVKVDGKEFSVTRESTVSSVRWWVWKSSGGCLAALINYDRQAGHKMRLSAPGIGQVKTLFGPAPKALDDGWVVELGPYEASAFTWGRATRPER